MTDEQYKEINDKLNMIISILADLQFERKEVPKEIQDTEKVG